jgi:hypothetical protein
MKKKAPKAAKKVIAPKAKRKPISKRPARPSPEVALSSSAVNSSIEAIRSGTGTAEDIVRISQRNSYSMPDDVLERELLNPERAVLLQEQFGPENYILLRDLARQAASQGKRGGARVLILPGIMGSKLGIRQPLFDDVLWFNPVQIAIGNLANLRVNGPSRYSAVGVILFAYLKLKLKLKIWGFDADFHPFDWRQNLQTLGAELAQRIDSEGREVHLVAHSMGGLVARAAIHKRKLNLGKLVMLGTPNHGSFAAVQVIRATYDAILQVGKLDLMHNEKELAS